jgi:hypothetical protein
MEKKDYLILQDVLYKYLMALHEVDSTFRFSVCEADFQEKAFQQGYWLYYLPEHTNIVLSFWEEKITPADARKRSIQLHYNIANRRWICYLKYPEQSSAYYQEIMTIMGGHFRRKGAVHGYTPCFKTIGTGTNELLDLHHFITEEKPKIDAYLKQNPVPFLDFIDAADFEKNKKKIDALRVSTVSEADLAQIEFLKTDFALRQLKLAPKRPFFLKRLFVSNYLGIEKLIIEDLPTDAQWIFLTGENGFGKTCVLRAIAKGLVGDEDFVESLPTDARIYVNGYNWGQPFARAAQSKQLAENNFQIAAYGVSRFSVGDADSKKVKTKTYSLFSDDGSLFNIEQVLMASERDHPAKFKQLTTIFKKLIPNLADIKSEMVQDERQIRYYEQNKEGILYKPVSLRELAAGYRGILTMIGDMMIRLSKERENPLSDLRGIVLIDEIDAHLHPKYQYELPNLLSEIFPKVQFIVTTHSPLPILGASTDKTRYFDGGKKSKTRNHSAAKRG